MLTLESRQLHSYCMFDFLSYIPLTILHGCIIRVLRFTFRRAKLSTWVMVWLGATLARLS